MTKKRMTKKTQQQNQTLNDGSMKNFLNQLRNEAFIESVGSSTRLAGSKLSDDEVKNLLIELEKIRS